MKRLIDITNRKITDRSGSGVGRVGQKFREYRVRGFPNQWQNYLGDKHIDGTNDKFSTGFDSNRQWLKINRITDTDFFPEYTLEINGKKVSAKLWSTFSKKVDRNILIRIQPFFTPKGIRVSSYMKF